MSRIYFVAGSLVAGIVTGTLGDVGGARLPIAGCALAAGLASLVIGGRLRLAAVTAAAFLAGFALPLAAVPPAATAPGLYRVEASVEAVAYGTAEEGRREDTARWSTLVTDGGARVEDGRPLATRMRITVRGILPEGARVRFLARLHPSVVFRNESPHVPWASRPIAARGRVVGSPEVLEESAWAEARARIRGAIRRRLDATLPRGPRGVARALVLGDRRAVDRDRREVARRAGLAHVLAVSGLHVAITVGLLVAFLTWCAARWPALAARCDTARVAAALGAPLALAYAELAGGAPSARRAAWTAALFFITKASGRRPRALAVAATAIAALVVTDPEGILDPGLVLSVVATLAILTGLAPRTEAAGPQAESDAQKLRHPLATAAWVSTRATIATAPIVWWCFGAVPAVSIAANVVLAPLAGAVLVPSALAHTATACLAPIAAGPTAWVFAHVEAAFTAAASLFAALPYGHDLPPPTLAQGLTAGAGAIAVLSVRSVHRALFVAAATALTLAAFEGYVRHSEQPRGTLRVTFLDVDQGDSALVDLPDGSLMVIDGGGGNAQPGRRALLPILAARRRSQVDIAVLTHPHPDHYEGLHDLVEAVDVRELWDSGQAEAEADFESDLAQNHLHRTSATALLVAARRAGTTVIGPRDLCRAPRYFGGARVRVLAPCPSYDPGYDPNDNSLVLSLRFGHRSFLFTGDAEGFEEGLLARLGDAIRADVLKVPHHGSRTSSSQAFVEGVAPRLSVISAGIENRFGHPHPEVLRRLTAQGRVLATNRDGGVVVQTDGEYLEVRPFHGSPFQL